MVHALEKDLVLHTLITDKEMFKLECNGIHQLFRLHFSHNAHVLSRMFIPSHLPVSRGRQWFPVRSLHNTMASYLFNCSAYFSS